MIRYLTLASRVHLISFSFSCCLSHQQTYMRKHNDAILGKMHIRLEGMRTDVDRLAERGHAVLGQQGLEAAVGDGLREGARGVAAGGDGRGPFCGCLFIVVCQFSWSV